MKAAIIGATGYGGLELLRLLTHHQSFTVTSLHSFSQIGEVMTTPYPHLSTFVSHTLAEVDVEGIAKEADLVFLATPAGVSANLTPSLLEAGVRVIDLSGDFRIRKPAIYEEWYKKTAAKEEILQQAVYGLTEWKKSEIATANLIANPGCYATGALLAAAPLVKNGIIAVDSLIIDAKSGVSGAGKTPTNMTHFPEIHDNLFIYKVNEHQHIPEIEQILQEWDENMKPITFSTHLIPITRGIMVTLYAKAKQEITDAVLQQVYEESYCHSPFVRIREKGVFPSPKEVRGSNFCDIGTAYDKRTGRITIVAVIDNVMKGAAGQAVQNANILAGVEETENLHFMPLYP
ncbi:N-acetyl-gamma-glutamyl-phosphate reductase [Bacillus sp. BP-3]|uniref:N-acetyl-gamma-glutamyl-phosphate reductase n=1 Tax=Bacillus sp. BP-3 TaxID=3022773 RepID=UPI0023302AA2|nr:N-acetyl-gamma-glutamyl-phosphate reductase [Bacillus sp. BP-3]MDC2863542.1 N-acetyl-gamma-glutamyl-phosphate reductase [Bacillus sp. BP-3]